MVKEKIHAKWVLLIEILKMYFHKIMPKIKEFRNYMLTEFSMTEFTLRELSMKEFSKKEILSRLSLLKEFLFKTLSVREFVIVFVSLLIIFLQPLRIDGFFDDVLTVVAGIYLFVVIIKTKTVPKNILKILILVVLACGLGLLNNLISDIDRTPITIIQGMIYFTKVYICFCAANIFFEKGDNRRILKTIACVVRVTVLIASLFFMAHAIVDIGMTADMRYGLRTYKFVYETAAWFSQYIIIYLIILTADLSFGVTPKKITYIILTLFLWITPLRARGFVMIAVYVFYWIEDRKPYKDRKTQMKNMVNIKNIVILSLVVVVLAFQQIQKYFFSTKDTARSLLLEGGWNIMWDYFPFGAGFGTFCTQAAKVHYSPLYYRYGLDKFWALKPGGSELTDGYWPAVWGELGIIGFVIFLLLFALLCIEMIKKTHANKYVFMAVVTEIFYLAFSSTATGIMTSGLTAVIMVIVGYIINLDNKDAKLNRVDTGDSVSVAISKFKYVAKNKIIIKTIKTKISSANSNTKPSEQLSEKVNINLNTNSSKKSSKKSGKNARKKARKKSRKKARNR